MPCQGTTSEGADGDLHVTLVSGLHLPAAAEHLPRLPLATVACQLSQGAGAELSHSQPSPDQVQRHLSCTCSPSDGTQMPITVHLPPIVLGQHSRSGRLGEQKKTHINKQPHICSFALPDTSQQPCILLLTDTGSQQACLSLLAEKGSAAVPRRQHVV